jgi:hypothetical protein
MPEGTLKGDFNTMNFPAAHIEHIQQLGYTESEARFLYIAAVFSELRRPVSWVGLGTPKTRASRWEVPISRAVVEALKAHYSRSANRSPEGLVFRDPERWTFGVE